MTLWLPVPGRAGCALLDGVLHAVDSVTLYALANNRPVERSTACGRRFVALYGFDTPREGEREVATWPPPARNDPPRCRACWVATGRPRIAEQWRHLTPAEIGDT